MSFLSSRFQIYQKFSRRLIARVLYRLELSHQCHRIIHKQSIIIKIFIILVVFSNIVCLELKDITLIF